MLPSSAMHDVYDPRHIEGHGRRIRCCGTINPPHLQDYERARRRLALLIVRHMELGEPNANLGTLALSIS